jgi:hypothetical protein
MSLWKNHSFWTIHGVLRLKWDVKKSSEEEKNREESFDIALFVPQLGRDCRLGTTGASGTWRTSGTWWTSRTASASRRQHFDDRFVRLSDCEYEQ